MLKKYRLIFFFIPHHHIGGAERVHLAIIKSLPYKPIVFFVNSNSNQITKEFQNNAHCFLINNAKRRKCCFKLLQAISFFFSITLFGCNNSLFYDFVFKLNRAKSIDLTHAFSFPDEEGMENFSLPYIDLLDKRVVINTKTYDDYVKLYNQNNINQALLNRFTIIPNGIEINDFYSSKINFRFSNFTIGFVGRNSPEKRPELFFELVKNLNVKAKVIGDDFKNYKNDFPNAVYFENCNDKELIRNQFSDISLLIVASSREGFPLVIMEAMELGIPVLATDVGSVSEHLIDDHNGFIAPVEEEAFMKFALKKTALLMANEELYFNLSFNARKYAEKNFGIEKFNTKYRKLFYE